MEDRIVRIVEDVGITMSEFLYDLYEEGIPIPLAFGFFAGVLAAYIPLVLRRCFVCLSKLVRQESPRPRSQGVYTRTQTQILHYEPKATFNEGFSVVFPTPENQASSDSSNLAEKFTQYSEDDTPRTNTAGGDTNSRKIQNNARYLQSKEKTVVCREYLVCRTSSEEKTSDEPLGSGRKVRRVSEVASSTSTRDNKLVPKNFRDQIEKKPRFRF